MACSFTFLLVHPMPDHTGVSGQQDELDPSVQEFHTWLRRPRVHGQLEDFVPSAEVTAYFLDQNRLKELLKALFKNSTKRAPSARVVSTEYAKVLCILVTIGKGVFIERFAQYDDLADSRLPFDEQTDHFPSDGSDPGFFKTFQQTQHRFCSPKLRHVSHGGYKREYSAGTIIPYVEKEEKGDGGSAVVYRVKLHSEHHGLYSGRNQV